MTGLENGNPIFQTSMIYPGQRAYPQANGSGNPIKADGVIYGKAVAGLPYTTVPLLM